MADRIKRMDVPESSMELSRASYQPKPKTALLKSDLTRIGSQFTRLDAGMRAGGELTYRASQMIPALYAEAHRVTVPVMSGMAEKAYRYEGRPGFPVIADFTGLLMDQLGGQQIALLKGGSDQIIDRAIQPFDLDEDTRGRIKRWLEGERR